METNEEVIMEDVSNETEVVKEEKKGLFKNSKVKELETRISELEGVNASLKEEALRCKADLINYRKRKDEEVRKMLTYQNEDVILEVIKVIDDFERAIKLDDTVLDDELSKFLSGFKMIYAKLKDILDKNEVKEIYPLNEEFDPTYHQAVFTTKVENVNPGVVVEVMQKGYIYKDKVIRFAMVKVSE